MQDHVAPIPVKQVFSLFKAEGVLIDPEKGGAFKPVYQRPGAGRQIHIHHAQVYIFDFEGDGRHQKQHLHDRYREDGFADELVPEDLQELFPNEI
jgi:hypothetical protein